MRCSITSSIAELYTMSFLYPRPENPTQSKPQTLNPTLRILYPEILTLQGEDICACLHTRTVPIPAPIPVPYSPFLTPNPKPEF